MWQLPISLILRWTAIFGALVIADEAPYGPGDALRFEQGDYGVYPEVGYKTTDLRAPRPLLNTWAPECRNSNEKVVIAPRGSAVKHPGAIMLDGNGHLVWHDLAFKDRVAYGATVQNYRQTPYLTFWTGSDKHRGIGQGDYYMFDQSYTQFKKISAQSNYSGDLHEFAITLDNTAVLTSYVSTPRDLTAQNGPKDGYIWDGIFQEIDIETNELLFSWKATDHFTFEDCHFPLPNKTKSGTSEEPWDWFHINSIEKDRSGNYLISSRYLQSLVYIDGKSGEPIWILGGTHNEFEDLSNGNATNFKWQHHARWSDGGSSITIFDNHVMSTNMNQSMDDAHPSRGLKIKVDTVAKTASVVWELYHPKGFTSVSQGSLQELDGGRRFINWGAAAAFTEYDRNGAVTCDAEYGAMFAQADHKYRPGTVMSYRGFKVNWVGRPHYVPKVLFENGIMYVSWNGATEVVKWSLQGTDSLDAQEHEWAQIGDTDWLGYENTIEVGPYDYAVYRLIAHGSKGQHEGLWRVFSSGLVETIVIKEPPATSSFLNILFWLFVGAILATLLILFTQRGRNLALLGGQWRIPFLNSNKLLWRGSPNSNGYALASRQRSDGQAIFDHYQDELRDMVSDDDEEIESGVNMGPDVPVLKSKLYNGKAASD